MHANPERAAWTVLLSAFSIFCALATLLPVGGRWWLRHAAASQVITLTSTGTVLVTRPGRTTPEANLVDIPVGSVIASNSGSQANLVFASRNGSEVLATLTIYGNTRLEILQADTPRYRTGVNPHRIRVSVAGGRVRASIASDVAHPVSVHLTSEPGAQTVLSAPGSFASLEATYTQTMVTVREGQAAVSAQGATVTIMKDERAEVAADGPPRGPLPAERNLIANGDFQDLLNVGWTVDPPQRADPNDSPGVVEVVTSEGRRAVHFERPGRGWGQIGITQEIQQDVRDYKSLRLQLDVLVSGHTVWNCGQQGTECPVMVKVRYLDNINGSPREWVQGFFEKFSPNPDLGPLFCANCTPPGSRDHQRVTAGQWANYEYDLLTILRESGLPVASIQSITIYASGHTFDSRVRDVQLLATE